ncbi:hypothetical protein VTK73DRAFT_9478 [Phialemonium thermophilum]|uniref:Centromere protein H C-terminal domain-containing protein n=1 Tax=Phialemonium thermophilum TaxID=223376 RepID=A0ABR3Y499_9PEZI
MDEPPNNPSADDVYLVQVDQTVRELQRLVTEREKTLNELQTQVVNTAEDELHSAKASMDAMAAAYDALAESVPFLPVNSSVLPALLALRKTHQITLESKIYADSQQASLKVVKRQLELETVNVRDQRALQIALESRLQSLRQGLETNIKKTAKDVARETLEELKQQKEAYDRDTVMLLRALNKFIKDHLGTLLATEELGGPVVGEMMHIEPEDLGAGFNAHGKLKKSKNSATQKDMRQRKIDDIWGARNDRVVGENQQRERNTNDQDEATAAGAEMRDLIEQLLNSLANSQGDSSAAYVTIAQETAAVRFLIRSGVAQFHPRDSMRLRLVDFGRDIDN